MSKATGITIVLAIALMAWVRFLTLDGVESQPKSAQVEFSKWTAPKRAPLAEVSPTGQRTAALKLPFALAECAAQPSAAKYPETGFQSFGHGESQVAGSSQDSPNFDFESGATDLTESPQNQAAGSEWILPTQFAADDRANWQSEDASPVDRSPGDSWTLTITQSDIQIAGAHINYGKTLARKGATFSARNEFVNALAVLAQSFDLQTGTRDRSSALASGLRAIEEADDFYASSAGSALDTDVAAVIEGHLSQVFSREGATQITRSQALDAYYSYAAQQLEFALGTQNWLASEALYALGRLHGILGQANTETQPREFAKATVLHRLAIQAWPDNFASRNDLAVLLASQGQLPAARELLIQALTVQRRSELWLNLASVHQQLGELDLAELAKREAELLRTQATEMNSQSGRAIRWVQTSEFEATPDTQDAGPQTHTAQQPPAPSTRQR